MVFSSLTSCGREISNSVSLCKSEVFRFVCWAERLPFLFHGLNLSGMPHLHFVLFRVESLEEAVSTERHLLWAWVNQSLKLLLSFHIVPILHVSRHLSWSFQSNFPCSNSVSSLLGNGLFLDLVYFWLFLLLMLAFFWSKLLIKSIWGAFLCWIRHLCLNLFDKYLFPILDMRRLVTGWLFYFDLVLNLLSWQSIRAGTTVTYKPLSSIRSAWLTFYWIYQIFILHYFVNCISFTYGCLTEIGRVPYSELLLDAQIQWLAIVLPTIHISLRWAVFLSLRNWLAWIGCFNLDLVLCCFDHGSRWWMILILI